MKAAAVIVLAAAVVASGCGKSPSEAEAFNPVGTVSFSYSGAASGRFTATGELALSAGGVPVPASGATAYRPDEITTIIAFRGDATAGDGFVLRLGEVTSRGAITLNALACQLPTSPECRTGVFVPNVSVAQLGPAFDFTQLAQQSYVMASGTVTVSTRSSTRLKGTFSGIAVRGDQNLGAILVISDGSFDVPVRPEQ